MAAYLAKRIEDGKLVYKTIVTSKRYARFKDDIDEILVADGYTIGEDMTITAPEA